MLTSRHPLRGYKRPVCLTRMSGRTSVGVRGGERRVLRGARRVRHDRQRAKLPWGQSLTCRQGRPNVYWMSFSRRHNGRSEPAIDRSTRGGGTGVRGRARLRRRPLLVFVGRCDLVHLYNAYGVYRRCYASQEQTTFWYRVARCALPVCRGERFATVPWPGPARPKRCDASELFRRRRGTIILHADFCCQAAPDDFADVVLPPSRLGC